jgi:beta-lactamase regulating signal transducer with metallopeptidase domain
MIRALFLENLSLWSCVWQSTLLIVIGLTGALLFRHRPARAFQILLLAMMAAVLVPTMSLLVTHFELGAFAADPIELRVETVDVFPTMSLGVPAGVTEPPSHIEAMDTATEDALAKEGSGGARIPWRTVLMFGWMSVTLILLGRLLVAFINGVRLIRRSHPKVCTPIQQALDRARARLGISRNLQIRSSGEITSPMIWCWSKTAVLLVPRDSGNDIDWDGVVCHELAHCMRRDHISGLIAEMLACLLCWNPLSWLAKKRLIRLGEQACDDWVVAGEQPIENYARSLLDFKPQKQAAFLPGVVHSNKGVAARVHRILGDSHHNPRAGVKWALVSSTVVAFLSVGIAFAQTRPAQVQDEPQVPPKTVKSIHNAVADGDLEEIKLLLAKGSDVDTRDKEGSTPVERCASQGRNYQEVVELLVAKGAEMSPLSFAAHMGDGARVKRLIEKGADVNSRTQSGMTALCFVDQRSTDVVEFLIDSGADVNVKDSWNWTPLHTAADRGHRDVAKLLIAKGAYVNATDGWERTPFWYAQDGDHTELIELLGKHGAKE